MVLTKTKSITMRHFGFLILLLIITTNCSEKSKEQLPPVISPFSNVDTLAIIDWWNRANNPIINLKVNRDSVIAFGIYTVSNNTLKLSAQLYPLYPKETREVRLEIEENGEWKEIPALSVNKDISYPNIGERPSYLLYHEELESLVKNFPSLKRARFWMTFGPSYINHLQVLESVGMTSIVPIKFRGLEVAPLEFLKAVLPLPESLGENYSGETSIGCHVRGIKDGKEKSYYIWNNCQHARAFAEVKSQAVSYTTGVPAMLGAYLMLTHKDWMKPGVFNCEELNPEPFLENLSKQGLAWHEKVNAIIPFND